MNQQGRTLAFFPLLLVLFVDSLGLAFFMPLFAPLFAHSYTPFFSPDVSIYVRNIYYGVAISIFPICAFIAAPMLGSLSDYLGRRSVLLICLLGSVLGYLISGFAIPHHSLAFFLTGRLIDGLTAGSIGIAQAAIIDFSQEHERTTYLGWLLFAIILGLFVGPILSAISLPFHLAGTLSLEIPFFVIATLSLINLLIVLIFFKETIKTKVFNGMFTFVSAFKDSRVRTLSTVFLFEQFAWAIFFQFAAVYLVERFSFGPMRVGIFMALVGFGMMMALLYLIGKLSNEFILPVLVVTSLAIASLLMVIFLMADATYVWVFSLPIAVAFGVAYVSQVGCFAKQVSAEYQGWVMGITGAISFFSFGISGILSALLADVTPILPLFIAAIFLIFSALVAWRVSRFWLI